MLRYLKKKVHGLARSPNFENGIAPPLGVLGRKFFGVLNNSLGGTSGPSMSKIGDVRVPNHFDPCWNCPKVIKILLRWSYSDQWQFSFISLSFLSANEEILRFLTHYNLWHNLSNNCWPNQMSWVKSVITTLIHLFLIQTSHLGPLQGPLFKKTWGDPNSPTRGNLDHLNYRQKRGPLGARRMV